MSSSALVTPHNTVAEQGVLGSMLRNANTTGMEQVFAKLKPESFYTFAHNKIFEQMAHLAKNNQPIDLITLDERLKSVGILQEVGGLAYLAELAKNTPSAANMLVYADLVRDCAIKRFTIGKLNECEKLLYGRENAEDTLETLAMMFSQIGDYAKEGKTSGLISANDVAVELVQEWALRESNPEALRGLTSGIEALDELLSPKGFVKGSLVVVGARPKVGKTTFYSQMALNCVLKERKRAVLFSLEMSRKQIFERMLGQVAHVNTNIFYRKNGMADDEQMARVHQAVADLTATDLLMIDDTPAVSIAHIRGECRRIVRERGEIGLVAIDYLTLMTADKAERNDLAYGKVVQEIKNLARELNCVVLLLTQLNRGSESRADKRPLPSDSRDTGQVEQECDYWIGIHRESMFNENADKSLTELIVRSNRHGESGTVYCDFRHGAIYQADQQEAKQRANAHKGESKKSRLKGEF